MGNEIYLSEETLKSARSAGRKITAIGGGTGLSSLLLGLKEYTENITAIVTVTDDGGGSGKLREEFNMLPPGDIRNCLLALANITPSMSALINHRFMNGSLKGQSFGNLFLLALNEIYGSFEEAVAKMNEFLAVTGKVLPVTTANAQIYAVFGDNKKILGETAITEYKKKTSETIVEVGILPQNAKALPDALTAIEEADVIILGPGSLYTSIVPNLLVDGVKEAIAQSKALKVYVMNVMTQNGETEQYTALQHFNEIEKYLGEGIIDVCLANVEKPNRKLIERYREEGAVPIAISKSDFKDSGVKLVCANMLSRDGTHVRHDPLRLSYNIIKTASKLRPRKGLLKIYDDLLLKQNI